MMLVNLVTFFIYVLLGTNKAVAQLDFGTYKIIHPASRSVLCSHEAGEPIYVESIQENSCARELWELGPGDGQGLYTIKNIGLNSSIQANKMSGSSIITSNGKTSFAIGHTEGRGHTIRFPDSDLVWTVVPTAISRGDILLRPESTNDTQLWTLINTNDAIAHAPVTEFTVQARDFNESSTLAFLRGIEKLGGSAGYQMYLESPHTTPNYTHIASLTSDTLTNSIYAWGDVFSFVIYTQIDVTAGEYSGTGHAWGIGIGGIAFAGTLFYDSWEVLLSAENGITIVGGGVGANAVLILFSVNGNDVAVLTVAGAGGGALLGVRGTFTWTHT